MSFIASLGDIQYPLWIVLILVLLQIARCTAQLVRGEGSGSPLRTHSILVLGALGACLGVLGTLIGVRVVADAVATVAGMDGATAREAIETALAPSVLGFSMLGIASVAWLALQYGTARRA